MKQTSQLVLSLITALLFNQANAQGLEMSQFTGDTRLACEALLCLTSAQPPHECNPSLQRYFSITGKHIGQDRMNFLNLCPTASSTPEMQRLTSALVSGSGQCSVATLNSMQLSFSSVFGDQTGISNQLPPTCSAYYANPLISASYGEDKPVYVGTPDKGGYWVSQKDYPAALADYNRLLQQQRSEDIGSGY